MKWRILVYPPGAAFYLTDNGITLLRNAVGYATGEAPVLARLISSLIIYPDINEIGSRACKKYKFGSF
jgi:hypothetical protein